jgi:RNA polymerase sigma factor (sigma-70 family)
MQTKPEPLLTPELLRYLPPREQKILMLHYGLEGYKKSTLPEIGGLFGVTGERIRQIEKQALSRLQKLTEIT